MKLKCKLFGHKYVMDPMTDTEPHCERCGGIDYVRDEKYIEAFKTLCERIRKANEVEE